VYSVVYLPDESVYIHNYTGRFSITGSIKYTQRAYLPDGDDIRV